MAKGMTRFSNFDHEEFLEKKLREKKKSLERKKKINEGLKKQTYVNDDEETGQPLSRFRR